MRCVCVWAWDPLAPLGSGATGSPWALTDLSQKECVSSERPRFPGSPAFPPRASPPGLRAPGRPVGWAVLYQSPQPSKGAPRTSTGLACH